MEVGNCDEEATAAASADSRTVSAMQQADSAQSLAASSSCSCSTSASTSTCADFSSGGEGGAGSEESPTMAGARLSLAMDPRQGLLGQACSRGRACSTLSLTLQQHQQHQQHQQQQQQQQLQQRQQLLPAIGRGGMRPRQAQSVRQRSNAISAKSMSSYLAVYKETKNVYFDAVLTGEIPVRRNPARTNFD